jgi:hypothetical protein
MAAVRGWDAWKLSRIATNARGEDILSSRRQGKVPFLFSDARALAAPLGRVLGADGRAQAIANAEKILGGKLPFFGRLWFDCGSPPNWFRNPVTGQTVEPGRRWTTMRFADPVYGDLKFILEPSRFLFVYALARAFALTGEERFAESFWRFFEDWCGRNPPMDGPLWVCGQECSLRILAWSFALYAFMGAAGTTPERVELLVSAIAAHAWRVEQTIGYARSQRSNHLLTEGVGLWTSGLLYPELKQAQRYRASGLKLLREAAIDQITASGVHLQYSFNYQRMVLQLLLWTLRFAEIHETPLPGEIHERAGAALDLLSTFIDSKSGDAPNYGANDGTLILPLAMTDYRDYRPSLRMGSAAFSRKTTLIDGAWDEAAIWLGEKTAVVGSNLHDAKQRDRDATGYYRIGNQNSWAMVRSGNYTRRPFQADQLHVDLWWQGLNLALDPGTYLYNGGPPWDNGLASTAVHNTVMIDEREQMRRAGRFLWLDWAQARGRVRSLAGVFPDCFEGHHDGYKSIGVIHRRTVTQIADGAWIIEDDLAGKGQHEARLHWLLADLPFEVESQLPLRVTFRSKHGPVAWHVFSSTTGAAALSRAGKTLQGERGRFEPLMGWQSPTYGELAPAVSLVYRVRQSLPTRLITVTLAGEGFRTEAHKDAVTIWQNGARIHEVGLAVAKT